MRAPAKTTPALVALVMADSHAERTQDERKGPPPSDQSGDPGSRYGFSLAISPRIRFFWTSSSVMESAFS